MGKRLTHTTVGQHEVGVGDSIALGKTLGCGDNFYLSQSMMLASFTKPRKFAASLS